MNRTITLVDLWKVWTVTNLTSWTAFEYYKHSPKQISNPKDRVENIYYLANGLSKGIVCSLFPIAIVSYISEEFD